MAEKPALSREYLYLPLTNMNFDISTLDVHGVAFTEAGVQPEEADWLVAIVVDENDDLFDPDIGEGLAILLGPERGDAVSTEELGEGSYQTWVDVSVPSSDERVVRVAGTTTISATGA